MSRLDHVGQGKGIISKILALSSRSEPGRFERIRGKVTRRRFFGFPTKTKRAVRQWRTALRSLTMLSLTPRSICQNLSALTAEAIRDG